MMEIYTKILYNISIGVKYFCYFLEYIFFNYTKIPLRVINQSYSLFSYVYFETLFMSTAAFEWQESNHNYVIMYYVAQVT